MNLKIVFMGFAARFDMRAIALVTTMLPEVKPEEVTKGFEKTTTIGENQYTVSFAPRPSATLTLTVKRSVARKHHARRKSGVSS